MLWLTEHGFNTTSIDIGVTNKRLHMLCRNKFRSCAPLTGRWFRWSGFVQTVLKAMRRDYLRVFVVVGQSVGTVR